MMHPKSIYIAPIEARAGSLIVSIGFMEILKGNFSKVAFFRPIIPDNHDNTDRESDIDLMLTHFELDMPYEASYGFSVSQYSKAYAEGQEETLHETLISKVNQLHEDYDFVLIQGYPRDGFASLFDFDVNLKIAKNLNTLVVPIINAKGKSSTSILNEVQMNAEAIETEGCTHFATFINRCNENIIGTLKQNIAIKKKKSNIYLLPEIKELNRHTINQVSTLLHAKVLIGDTQQLQHIVYGHKIASMGIENYISHINNGDLVLVAGDRLDIILASLVSAYSKEHPNISGIILTGGIIPSDSMMKLVKDFYTLSVPIMSVLSDSYQTALALERIKANITAKNTRKISVAKGIFDTAIDKERLIAQFKKPSKESLTPMMFQYSLFERARQIRQKIVLPESSDERILRATEILIHRDVVDIVLLGNKTDIQHRSQQMGLDISKAEIIDPQKSHLTEKFSHLFYVMRKQKGLTLDKARDAMVHPNYFATMMVQEGLADGMVSGANYTTTETVRPALQIIKTKADIDIVSSVFFMCLDTRVLVYGDCAINLNPDAETLAQIAISSADTATQFGIEPRVAMLSYSTGDSGSGPEVDKVRKATKLAQAMRPNLLIEGPIQYDAAIDEKVAKKKLPYSKVAGRATVFVFPNLNTGNNTYKAVQRSSHALAIGPVLQGLRLPINDLSRGCLVEDIVNTVIITAIQAQNKDIS